MKILLFVACFCAAGVFAFYKGMAALLKIEEEQNGYPDYDYLNDLTEEEFDAEMDRITKQHFDA